jgi:hypothetical protein
VLSLSSGQRYGLICFARQSDPRRWIYIPPPPVSLQSITKWLGGKNPTSKPLKVLSLSFLLRNRKEPVEVFFLQKRPWTSRTDKTRKTGEPNDAWRNVKSPYEDRAVDKNSR